MKHILIGSLCCGLLVLTGCRSTPAPIQSPFPEQTPSSSVSPPQAETSLPTPPPSPTLLPVGTAMSSPNPSPTPTVIPINITPVPDVFMAQLRIRDAAVMEALLVGTLIVDETDNCLKVQTDDEVEPILVVWQPDYLLHNGDGVLQIVDATGKTVAQVGKTINIGGGEQRLTDSLQASLKEPIPANCVDEKIWRMGDFLPETGTPTPTTTTVPLPQPTVTPTPLGYAATVTAVPGEATPDEISRIKAANANQPEIQFPPEAWQTHWNESGQFILQYPKQADFYENQIPTVDGLLAPAENTIAVHSVNKGNYILAITYFDLPHASPFADCSRQPG